MKKKLWLLLAMTVLTVVALCVSVSAELYNPDYYTVAKVQADAITVDGAVEEAYGDPIFYYVSDGSDEVGDYTSAGNWFFTRDQSENRLSLIKVSGQYVKGYAAWTTDALYVCIDTNIYGWNHSAELTAQTMWKAFSVQLGIFDFESGDNIDLGLAINEAGKTLQRNFGQNKNNYPNDLFAPLPNSVKSEDGNAENDMTDLDAKVTRDQEHVIYEVKLAYDKVLSFVPTNGAAIGLDICVNFGEYDDVSNANIQKCLTFVNNTVKGYHSRDISTARPLYFVNDAQSEDQAKASAQALADRIGQLRVTADNYTTVPAEIAAIRASYDAMTTLEKRYMDAELMDELVTAELTVAYYKNASASVEDGTPTLVISDAGAYAGERVTLAVAVENNPGFAALVLTPEYDSEVLTLIDVRNAYLFEDFENATNLIWDAGGDKTEDAPLMFLTFELKEGAKTGDYAVTLEVRECSNLAEQDITLAVKSATVSVLDTLYGDANGDYKVDGKDILRLRKYLANYNYDTGTSTIELGLGADANGDGKIDGKDILIIRKYLANYDYDTGKSTIVLGPTA